MVYLTTKSIHYKILYFSILQQGNEPPKPSSSTQLITGMPFPLPKDSPAQRDPRYSQLRKSISMSAAEDGSGDGEQSVAMLRKLWNAGEGAPGVELPQLVEMVIKLADAKLTRY